MVRSNLTRRDFNKLAAAAFGGVVTGTMVGCGDTKSGKSEAKTGSDAGGEGGKPDTDVAYLMNDTNVCRGLNTCKNNGKGTHDCAGTSSCHNLKADQSCGGENECKGRGGCKSTAGINACDGKGECAVPLKPETWTKVRAKFKAAWEAKNAGKTLGDAPA